MCKSILYRFFLTVILLSSLPLCGMAQQADDIKKPTRTRVAGDNKDKKDKNASTKQQPVENKDDKKDNKKKDDKKPEKVTDRKPEKPDEVKDDKAPAKPEAVKPVPDTAAKPAVPVKPKPVPVNPDKVQFDGIDISKHQGNINWEELKKNPKIKFVYIKATEGSNHVDSRYKENIKNARKHGFKVGSYHFFTDLSSAQQQFQNFITTAKREEQDLLPVIDVEKCRKWTPQQLRDSIKVFADLIEDYYGCKPLIYTFETFYNKYLGKAFAKYPIFIAKYPKGNEKPNINGVNWILWQFSESGQFKGVKDNLVDMSRFNEGYGLRDILYVPSKHKPRVSVRDAVDHKEKPSTVTPPAPETKPAPTPSKKQQEEAKRKADRDKKAQERNKKIAEDEARKKAEADKKAKEKAEQLKKERERQAAREAAAKREAEAKAKRKAAAQEAKQKARQQAAGKSGNKSANLMQTSNSKLAQSQRNDSIRAAQNKGRKNNKSSADND